MSDAPPPPTSPHAAPAADGTRPWYKKKRFVIPLALVVVFFLIGALAPAEEEPDGTVAADRRRSTTTEEAVRSTTTEAPTTTTSTEAPTTTVPATPEERLNEEALNALGEGNRDVPRVAQVSNVEGTVEIRWAINDNLTEGFTKDGARRDGVDILTAVRASGIDATTVRLVGTFSLQDQFGNVSEDEVVRATYTTATLERFNFENFDAKQAYEPSVADEVWVHPAFVY